jgi:hypothetical protein
MSESLLTTIKQLLELSARELAVLLSVALWVMLRVKGLVKSVKLDGKVILHVGKLKVVLQEEEKNPVINTQELPVKEKTLQQKE